MSKIFLFSLSLVSMIILSVAQLSFAADGPDYQLYTGTIEKIKIAEDGIFTLFVNSTNEYMDDHVCKSNQVRMKHPDGPGADRMFSFLLASKLKGSAITFTLRGQCVGQVATFTIAEDA